MAPKDWELRPPDEQYYAIRTDYFRQGDIFRDVPLGYPMPPEAFSHSAGSRKFLSGPFEPGFGLLLTPTCSMTAQGEAGAYAHPVRTLAPVLPLVRLVDDGAVKAGALDDLRRFDHLVNYLYLPAIDDASMPESLALLYAAITIHHDYLEGGGDDDGDDDPDSGSRRIAQLSEVAAVHLKYKLTALFAGELFAHADFADTIR
jgi:hypothetical protein